MATSSPLGTESLDGTITALFLGLPHFFCLNKEQGIGLGTRLAGHYYISHCSMRVTTVQVCSIYMPGVFGWLYLGLLLTTLAK